METKMSCIKIVRTRILKNYERQNLIKKKVSIERNIQSINSRLS